MYTYRPKVLNRKLKGRKLGSRLGLYRVGVRYYFDAWIIIRKIVKFSYRVYTRMWSKVKIEKRKMTQVRFSVFMTDYFGENGQSWDRQQTKKHVCAFAEKDPFTTLTTVYRAWFEWIFMLISVTDVKWWFKAQYGVRTRVHFTGQAWHHILMVTWELRWYIQFKLVYFAIISDMKLAYHFKEYIN